MPNYPILAGQTAYSFKQGAIAAIHLKLSNTPAWRYCKYNASIESLLHQLETYNVAGYRKVNIPSPYWWADSTVQKLGKYIIDGVFSTSTIDRQIRTVTLLKYYLTKNKK